MFLRRLFHESSINKASIPTLIIRVKMDNTAFIYLDLIIIKGIRSYLLAWAKWYNPVCLVKQYRERYCLSTSIFFQTLVIMDCNKASNFHHSRFSSHMGQMLINTFRYSFTTYEIYTSSSTRIFVTDIKLESLPLEE